MLTSGQCRVAAYLTDGDVVCVSCGEKRMAEALGGLMPDEFYDQQMAAARERNGGDLTWYQEHDVRDEINDRLRAAEEKVGLQPLIQYNLDSDESWQAEGLSCGDCGETLVEPWQDEEIERDDEAKAQDEWDASGNSQEGERQ
jgi:hypothetical protein